MPKNSLNNDFEVKNETTLDQELEIYFKVIVQDVDMNPSKESLSKMLSAISFPAEHPVSTPYFIPASLKSSVSNSARPQSIIWKIGVPVTALALVLGATMYSASMRSGNSAVVQSTNEFSTLISDSKEFSEDSFNDMTSEEDTLATAYTGVINNYSINENDF